MMKVREVFERNVFKIKRNQMFFWGEAIRTFSPLSGNSSATFSF